MTGPMAPELLFSTAPFFRRPLDEAFRRIASAGYRGVEVMVGHDPATRDPRLLSDAAARHGLSIEAIHAPFLILTRGVFGSEPIGKVRRTVELALNVGASLVVVHPPYRWQNDYRKWLEGGMPELADRTGVAIAVENMFPLRMGTRRGMRLHHGHGPETLPHGRVVLDTSHAAVAGLDLLRAVESFGERLAHIHLSNNAGRGWDSHLPVYEGALALDDLLEELVARGYEGGVSLELDLRPYFDDEAELAEVLVRNREFCERAMGKLGTQASGVEAAEASASSVSAART